MNSLDMLIRFMNESLFLIGNLVTNPRCVGSSIMGLDMIRAIQYGCITLSSLL